MKFKISLISLLVFILCVANTCGDYWGDSKNVQLSLAAMEAYNLDNSGENPIINNDSIRKEAYIIGLKYKVVSDSFYINELNDRLLYLNTNVFKFRVFCNEPFNDFPEGSDITDVFSLYDNDENYSKLLVLRVAPKAGEYSFKIECIPDSGKVVKTVSNKIKLY